MKSAHNYLLFRIIMSSDTFCICYNDTIYLFGIYYELGKELNLQQLDATLNGIMGVAETQRPSTGWINTIRTSLGMSARSLGKRIGLSQARVALIEKGEIDGSISIKTLEKVSRGLGCWLVYALVPEDGSLQKIRERQATKKANILNENVERHMELEGQATDKTFREATTAKIAEDYLRT